MKTLLALLGMLAVDATPFSYLPFSGHVVVQTTPTSIPVGAGMTKVTLNNYATAETCCTWTLPDAGPLPLPDGGTLPGPTLGGPSTCLLDVQTSGTGTPIPGQAVFPIGPGVTVSCVSSAAQSTDGGDLRFVQVNDP